MIRIIVEVSAPIPDEARPGNYKTFDVVCPEMETFLSANGLKGLLGYEIRQVAAVTPIKKEEAKPDVDALPKDADAITKYKHGKAMELKKDGKLPAKLNDKETILEQYKRYQDSVKADAEKKEKAEKEKGKSADEKKRQEFNKRLKAAQAQWDAHSWVNTLRRVPRPTKESWKALEDEADKAAA